MEHIKKEWDRFELAVAAGIPDEIKYLMKQAFYGGCGTGALLTRQGIDGMDIALEVSSFFAEAVLDLIAEGKKG